MRLGFHLLGLMIVLSLSACGKAEPTAKSRDEFRKFQEDTYQAKIKAGKEAFEAKRFDDAIALIDEATLFGPLDEASSEMLAKARVGKHRALVSDGHDAMKTRDYEAARKAYSDALAIFIDNDVRNFLNEAIAKAWVQAGAEVGWMRVRSEGLTFSLEEQPEYFAPPKSKLHEYHRSFKFRAWKAGMLSSLPVPQESFGLDLSGTSFDDESVDELSRLKSIDILNVRFTRLTNAGREQLRKTVFVRWLAP